MLLLPYFIVLELIINSIHVTRIVDRKKKQYNNYKVVNVKLMHIIGAPATLIILFS